MHPDLKELQEEYKKLLNAVRTEGFNPHEAENILRNRQVADQSGNIWTIDKTGTFQKASPGGNPAAADPGSYVGHESVFNPSQDFQPTRSATSGGFAPVDLSQPPSSPRVDMPDNEPRYLDGGGPSLLEADKPKESFVSKITNKLSKGKDPYKNNENNGIGGLISRNKPMVAALLGAILLLGLLVGSGGDDAGESLVGCVGTTTIVDGTTKDGNGECVTTTTQNGQSTTTSTETTTSELAPGTDSTQTTVAAEPTTTITSNQGELTIPVVEGLVTSLISGNFDLVTNVVEQNVLPNQTLGLIASYNGYNTNNYEVIVNSVGTNEAGERTATISVLTADGREVFMNRTSVMVKVDGAWKFKTWPVLILPPRDLAPVGS